MVSLHIRRASVAHVDVEQVKLDSGADAATIDISDDSADSGWGLEYIRVLPFTERTHFDRNSDPCISFIMYSYKNG